MAFNYGGVKARAAERSMVRQLGDYQVEIQFRTNSTLIGTRWSCKISWIRIQLSNFN